MPVSLTIETRPSRHKLFCMFPLFFQSSSVLFCAGVVSFWWTEITLLLQLSEKDLKCNVLFLLLFPQHNLFATTASFWWKELTWKYS